MPKIWFGAAGKFSFFADTDLLCSESAMHCKPQRTSVLITKGRYEDDDIVQRGQVKGMVFLMNNLPSKHVTRNFDNHPKKALAVGVGVTL